LKGLVRNPITYRVIRPPLDLLTGGQDNRAFRVWVRFLLHITGSAYSRKRPVIWISAFTPVEIAYAIGAIPIIPEIFASLVTYLGQSRRPLALSTSVVSSDICSFFRCAAGLVQEGYLPEPNLILSSSQVCDGANKFFHFLSQVYGCPHLMLDPPYDADDYARRYLVGQLRHLVNECCRLLSLTYDEEMLSRTLLLSRLVWVNMLKVNALRKSSPSPFPGGEGLSYLAGMGFYSPGSLWGVRFFQSLCSQLERKVAQGEGYLPQERYRLLWLHHIRPYYRNDIFQVLEKHDAAVSFEEGNYLYWPEPDPARPLESIADKIMSNVWAGPLEKRLRAIEKMVEDYDIDGVIHFSHWGCRQSCGGASIIGDRLRDRGIPYAILHGDGADPENYSPGQTRTRLEALLEMLR